ncbi:twin transmembrane helix small protein [Sneathiella glossodoripedis]|uniref:twin transmembrane helix small protein n=1 Tax=Sneathiella glossodoripedis TaxID=418853 RepID=UPI00046E6FCD|nr:twin transmembrane helix small protein [Sneathiella glossodoripedis]
MINYFIIAAVIATALVVLLGVLNMGRQGENRRLTSNKLMRLRIVMQAIAIALVMIGLALGLNEG